MIGLFLILFEIFWLDYVLRKNYYQPMIKVYKNHMCTLNFIHLTGCPHRILASVLNVYKFITIKYLI